MSTYSARVHNYSTLTPATIGTIVGLLPCTLTLATQPSNTNERTASWESQSTKLLEAYNWLSTRASQTFTDDIKVMKLGAMIKVPGNNALAIAVEYMRNTFCSDFEGAVTYITGRMNKINQMKPSAGTRHVSTAARKTSWN